MTEKQTVAFQDTLLAWFAASRRDLPWRHARDPYAIWVSEAMLQQTQVATVIPYYRSFLQRFPDVQALAGADQQEVLKRWEGLGYYGRARNLHKAAQRVMQEHQGRVPREWDAFRGLPGVGDYIAAAVLSIAFGKPYPVVDGNVKRVLSRLHLLKAPVNQPASLKDFRAAAEELLKREDPGTFNQAIMELGALICRPRQPVCAACPVQRFCRAVQAGRVSEFPKRIQRRPTPQFRIAAGVVFRRGKVLITRRKPEGLLGGLWEFPGGKIQGGETAEGACIREMKEEVGLTVRIASHLCTVRHAYTHFRIVMDVFCCTWVSGRVTLNGPVDYRWITPDELNSYPFPKANHKFMALLGTCSASMDGR